MKTFIIGVIITVIIGVVLLLIFALCKISGKASDAERRREEEEKFQ